jgi:hypothetical protein
MAGFVEDTDYVSGTTGTFVTPIAVVDPFNAKGVGALFGCGIGGARKSCRRNR